LKLSQPQAPGLSCVFLLIVGVGFVVYCLTC
jgi:hypothetical protein